jgi:hypothetical protein
LHGEGGRGAGIGGLESVLMLGIVRHLGCVCEVRMGSGGGLRLL